MKIMLEKDYILVSCQYQEKDFLKAIGDYKWIKTRNLWKFPQRKLVSIIDTFRSINYDPEIGKLYEKLLLEKNERSGKIITANKIKADSKEIKIPELDNIDSPCKSPLFYHQRKAIALASMFNSYALFLETGTGKTISAIRLIQLRKVPTMIVAPLSTLSSVWEEEISKWSNLKVTNLWHNIDAIDDNADVYLTNYGHFRKLHNKSMFPEKIEFLIIDESSRMKNHKSLISKAILYYKDKIKYRLILSGLPAPNNLLEFWPQMEFINEDLLD